VRNTKKLKVYIATTTCSSCMPWDHKVGCVTQASRVGFEAAGEQPRPATSTQQRIDIDEIIYDTLLLCEVCVQGVL
jgi:hypothetical protein